MSRIRLLVDRFIPATKADIRKILMTLDQLKAQVEANTTLEQSAVTLITGLAAQIVAAKDEPEKIQAIADELTASATSLSAALAANTPAAPTP